MSMYASIVGFKPADAKFKKMKAAYDACVAADIAIPDEVRAFFNISKGETCSDSGPIDDHGVAVELDKKSPGISEWSDDSGAGYEVDLRKLDPDVKILRFYNSW